MVTKYFYNILIMLCSYFTDGECRNTSGDTPSENQTMLGKILQPRMSPSQICQRTILMLNLDISTSILRKKENVQYQIKMAVFYDVP